jgi:hypothetical protein
MWRVQELSVLVKGVVADGVPWFRILKQLEVDRCLLAIQKHSLLQDGVYLGDVRILTGVLYFPQSSNVIGIANDHISL